MKKYINLYIASAIVFVAGIPTVLGSFAGVGIFAGTTAYLITHLIKPFGFRVVFYAVSLAASAVFVIISVVEFVSGSHTDEILSALVQLVLSGTVFLGIATAFAVRFVLWEQARRYAKNPKR